MPTISRSNEIQYFGSLEGIGEKQLEGFFAGWPNPPSATTLHKVLKNSTHVWLAQNTDGQIVGFINALSDKSLSAYIPLLEVLPEWQNKGIGTVLMRSMLETLGELYMVDVVCDKVLLSFYERFGMQPGYSAMRRC